LNKPSTDKTKKSLIEPQTLIIWGTDDRYLDKAGAELSTNYCRSATIKYVSGASHWVQQDEPDQVNSLIEQFLATD
jgi:pimeloyl-ACP methyl ester carboxylesterase